ncbi:MAG: translation initiation factor IF-3 [Patescibacteria group bacterium]
MRISRRKPNYHQKASYRYKTNQFIKSPQLRLIDEDGQNLGVMDTVDAVALAQERGLDLVEVSPLANPPVAKITNYSKLKYQEEKERRKEKAKQKKVEVKGIRLSLRISEHDIEIRVNQAIKFLNQDDKVKLELLLKGREQQHVNLARDIINQFIKSVDSVVPAQIEQPLNRQGGKLFVIIAKK